MATLPEVIENTDWVQTFSFMVSAIAVISFVWKIFHGFRTKITNEILKSRDDNVTLTKGVKDELISHTKLDNDRFDMITTQTSEMRDMLVSVDTKTKLLVDDKIRRNHDSK